MGLLISEITEVSPELVSAFAMLTPQLSASAEIPDEKALKDIVASSCNHLLVACEDEADSAILGALTLVVFRIPTGIRAWIEDVVVDQSARGRGIGEKLLTAAIDRARELGAKTVDLSSRPSREAANRLYQRAGFELRQTNSYRYKLS